MQPARAVSTADKLADEILTREMVKNRKVTRFLVYAHIALTASIGLIALVLAFLAFTSTSDSRWLSRILAETGVAVALLVAVPMLRMRAISRAAWAAVPGRPVPAAPVIRRIGDYWLSITIVIAFVTGLDFLFTGITWIMQVLGRFRA